LHQAEDVPETGTPDLLLYTPCPVKLVVKEKPWRPPPRRP
jgi:hypothetical protein